MKNLLLINEIKNLVSKLEEELNNYKPFEQNDDYEFNDSMTNVIEKLENEYENGKQEENYWEIINDINWQSVMKDTEENPNNHVKNYLIGFMDVDFVSDFKNFVVDRRKEIQETYKEYHEKTLGHSINFSDDSFWDVTASIVGMGESAYNMAIDTPSFVDFVYNSQNYHENFEYGFDAAIYEIQDIIKEWQEKVKNEYDED